MDIEALRDHAAAMLDAMARDLEEAQTDEEPAAEAAAFGFGTIGGGAGSGPSQRAPRCLSDVFLFG